MAAPNIINVESIIGKTVGIALTTGLTTTLLENTSSSNKVFKINSLIVSNIDGSSAADVTVDWYNGITGYKLASTVQVPADSTLVIVSKDTSLYLEENCSIRGGASADGDLECIISYEEIS
jgi:hypothetical protein